MITQRTEVLIIGGGIMGAAAAWQLATRGTSVILLEQFDLSHRRGSSHGASRIFRLGYDSPGYVRLAQQALPLWHELHAGSRQTLLRTTGAFDLGTPDALAPIAGALRDTGARYEQLSSKQVGERLRSFSLPSGWEAIFQPDGGVVLANEARLAMLDIARDRGVHIVPHQRVREIELVPDGVIARTPGGSWSAEQAVLATAGWSNGLLEPLGLHVPIEVTREHVAYFPDPGARVAAPFIWHADDTQPEFYGLPNGGRSELKLGQHGAGPPTDPDEEGIIEASRVARLREFVAQYLPGLCSSPDAVETCLYASTPDDDFVVHRHGPLVLAMGFGGHGFKFAPLIGSMVADLIAGHSGAALPRFSFERFLSTGDASATMRGAGPQHAGEPAP